VFFSDLEDFSTYAEQLPPNELLGRMSTYFEEVCRAISQEYGTVDKFIGDGVMAFWVRPIIDPITFCVLAPVRCGRPEGCRRSVTYGPRRVGAGCGCVSGSIARTYWSAISARRIASAIQ